MRLRTLLQTVPVTGWLMLAPLWASAESDANRPNVLLIMTDDQGHGDLGIHGNPILRTPNLDRFARESVRLDQFHVSPVCAPTRASLMTGRYNYRTGVVDTYLGRAMMHPDEVTIAELLGQAGYRTGIFGKWHLGDNYPLRPQDQGFQEVLIHRGGGIGQPSDPPVPGGDSYFDPILFHNGEQVQTKGYVSDVITDATIQFIEGRGDQPFFAYLSFNCPHTPLQVPDEYAEPYRQVDLSHDRFPRVGQPLPGQADEEATARIFGMVENIDDNLGRLFERLDELGIAENTLLIFLTDNGPQQVRYNSGLNGRKGSVYQGGIRVPCYARWPGVLEPGQVVETPAAHIDIPPTVLSACGVETPDGVDFDGKDLMLLLRGESVDWPDRRLFFQWHRGDEPELFRAFAVRDHQYKLVRPERRPQGNTEPAFELYDLLADPFELRDLAAENPEVVAELKTAHEEWFHDVGQTRGFDPIRIHLGTPHESPTVLTRQDWRGPRAGWAAKDLGYWEVFVSEARDYDIDLLFQETEGPAMLQFALGDVERTVELPAGSTRHTFEAVSLPAGPGRLEVEVRVEGAEPFGVRFVEVQPVNSDLKSD